LSGKFRNSAGKRHKGKLVSEQQVFIFTWSSPEGMMALTERAPLTNHSVLEATYSALHRISLHDVASIHFKSNDSSTM